MTSFSATLNKTYFWKETGWEVELSGLLGISLYTAPANNVSYHRTCFAAKPVQHHPERKLDPDIDEVVWLSLEEMQQRSTEMRSPLVIPAVERYLTRPHYPLDIFHPAGSV